ncbi:nuclear transport factor 2 family protein [Pseudomonas sp. XS1P51]
MNVQENVQIVKDAFAAVGRGDMQGLLALSAADIEWIIPGYASTGTGLRDGRGLQALTHRAHPKQFSKSANTFEQRQSLADAPNSR